MKHAKALSLAVATAAALMAFVGVTSASATVLCKTETDPCASPYGKGTEWAAELSGKSVFETTAGESLDKCEGSKTSGVIEEAGGSAFTVKMSAGITWNVCDVVTVTVKAGTLEIHKIAGTWEGTITGKGGEVTVGLFGGTCSFTTGNGIDIGTLKPGLPPRFILNPKLKKSAGGILCPAEVAWTAEYKFSTPSPVYVSAS
jgi:hypothetical protein